MAEIVLYRGFVVSRLEDISKRGLNFDNPQETGFHGECNWPRLGLSFGRVDFFDYAKGIEQRTRKIAVGSKITFTDKLLSDGLIMWGALRDRYGGIDCWQCINVGDVQRAGEFIISRGCLIPSWMNRLNTEICITENTYKRFDLFTAEHQSKPWWNGFSRRK
jgi:hypothetical protein